VTIYYNNPPVRLAIADGMPPLTSPLVRPVKLPPEMGRLFTATPGEYGYKSIAVQITPRGHWYRTDDERDGFTNDTLCRGCGHHGHFDYILDYVRCPKPATAQDITCALLGRTAVAA
jgi:hypothetical protein